MSSDFPSHPETDPPENAVPKADEDAPLDRHSRQTGEAIPSPPPLPPDDSGGRLSKPSYAAEPASLPPVVLGPMHLQVDDDAEETPRPLPEPYRRRVVPLHHELGSRELMLGWCFWLLGSWFALGMGLSGTPISRMIFASLVGLLVGWPVFRLSQDGCGRRLVSEAGDDADAAAVPQRSRLTPGLIFRDWVALNGVFQAVVWPHLLTGQWRFDQAFWVSIAVAAWSLLAGAIVAWGCGSCRGITRLAAMTLVLLLLLGEPAILALANAIAESNWQTRIHWTMHISPIEAVAALTVKSVDFDAGPWAATVACVITAGAAGWAWLAITRVRPARGPLVHRHGFR